MLGKALVSCVLAVCTAGSVRASQSNGLELSNLRFDQQFVNLLDKAQRALNQDKQFQGLFNDDAVSFNADRAIGNDFATTIKFKQTYNGLEVVGEDALVHFDKSGEIHDVTGGAIKTTLSTVPTLSEADAYRILADRYQQNVQLSEPAQLKVLEDFNGTPRLTYHMLTRTTKTHNGQDVYIDAHAGVIVLETPRAYHAHASQTVYRADTEEARKDDRVEAPRSGSKSRAPTDIDMEWYKKVIEDEDVSEEADPSAKRAKANADKVYDYYYSNFKRRSFDDKDSRLVSVVHIGIDWNNAFWTTEYGFMGYGDGDGDTFIDLTYGLDVAAHEMTHGVTAHTANLVYAGEAGALNESYSDFFGRMVDYEDGNWLIGHTIVGPKLNARAIRNMLNPEEFKQPKDNEDSRKIPTDGFCWSGNDYCGVHRNSGIPNRAAALVTQAIGKTKAEKLYYTVLTQRLRSKSDFSDARKQTLAACSQMFSADASECKAVADAFDTVKIK